MCGEAIPGYTKGCDICSLLGGGEGESDGKGRKSSILMRCGLEMERMRNKMVDPTVTIQKIK